MNDQLNTMGVYLKNNFLKSGKNDFNTKLTGMFTANYVFQCKK